MSLRIADMLSAARHRPAEYCWVTTCRAFNAAETAGQTLGYDQLRHLTLTALDRCRITGQLSGSQINLLVEFGVPGPPRADSAKRIVWDRALDILDSEMNRMVFPANPPPKSPWFFYGANGTPFSTAAEAWYWALDCLEARAEGSRSEAAAKVGRPCDPDDVINAMRRLELSPIHARTVVAWGKKRIEPHDGTEARRFWDEAMARLTDALREKGIVRVRRSATDLEVFAIAKTAPTSRPASRAHEPPTKAKPKADAARPNPTVGENAMGRGRSAAAIAAGAHEQRYAAE